MLWFLLSQLSDPSLHKQPGAIHGLLETYEGEECIKQEKKIIAVQGETVFMFIIFYNKVSLFSDGKQNNFLE